MKNFTTIREWFEEIKNLINCANPYFYDRDGREYVEFDADEKEFVRVSTELGWM